MKVVTKRHSGYPDLEHATQGLSFEINTSPEQMKAGSGIFEQIPRVFCILPVDFEPNPVLLQQFSNLELLGDESSN